MIYPERHDIADLTVTPLYHEPDQVLIAGSGLVTVEANAINWADLSCNYRCVC